MEVIKIRKNKEKTIYARKLNVAAYVRVSKKSEKQRTSFDSQINYYRNKIEYNANWNFIGIYADMGISGKNTSNRTEFTRLIEDSLDGKIDLILIKSVSRFARNTVDSLEYVRLLKANGIGIIFEEENINTLDMTSEMLLTVFSSIAQIERENYSMAAIYGCMMNCENKTLKFNSLPYGYETTEDHKVVINEKEAKVVKIVFDLCIDGYSSSQIVEYVKKKNLLPRKSWRYSDVLRILRNKRYCGTTIIKIKNTNKQYIIENSVPPIISEEKFELARKSLEKRTTSKPSHYYNNDNRLFNNKMKCGFCGGSYSYTNRNKMFLECNTARTTKRCIGRHFNGTYIMQAFVDLVNIIISDNTCLEKIDKIEIKIRKNKFEIEVLKDKICLLVDSYMNKQINIRYFNERKDYLNNSIQKLYDEINCLEREKEELENHKWLFNLIIKENKEKNCINEFSENLFNKVVSHIIIGGYDENKRKDYTLIRFIYDKKVMNKKVDRNYIFENNFRIVESFYSNQKIINRRGLVINKIKVTYEVKEEK